MGAHVLSRQSLRILAAVAVASGLAVGNGGVSRGTGTAVLCAVERQESAPARHEITVVARRYAYTPDRIEVTQDDLVKITLVAEDIPHSFTIDAYRIAKRAEPGHPVTFEFRADRPGTFVYYCNLSGDDGCSRTRGELVVKPRRP